MSEWKECTLGEVLNLRRGYDLPHSKMIEGIIPVAGSNGIIGTHNIATDIEPCITVGRSGSAGSTFFYDKAWAHNTTLYIDDFKGNDPKYLYYLLLSLPLKKMAGGSAVPSLNRNHIHPLKIRFPFSIEKQRAIASILSSLDAKIENNRKICANLEAQAQALFKHWFIDFAPFKAGKFVESELGMIPEGWRVGTLTDILKNIKDTTKQGDYPELPYLPIDSIPMNSFLVKDIKDNSEAQSSLILFKKYDILIGAMRVYFHRVIPAPFDGITRSTCFVVRPKIWNYYSFAICSVNSNQAILHAQKTSKGSTMPYAVWEGGLGAFSIVIPPESVAREFDYLIKKYIDIIQYTYFENQKLTSLRDTLLPKLMSGEIKV